MWKLLPILLLASCAVTEPRETDSNEDGTAGFRIVSTLDLPLSLSSKPSTGEPVTKEFQRRDTRGWIRATGAWTISSTVVHTRLRCATYETGIQLGAGDPGCSQVEWLTNADYGTRQTHCNSATLIHAGGGELADMDGIFDAATCVRVVTRCAGTC